MVQQKKTATSITIVSVQFGSNWQQPAIIIFNEFIAILAMSENAK
ncbi:MAG TPA: hypothetical protein VHG71_00930 [Verrucomicrobiae bacterium]|nr:hypothetical protein [Verrucomicrobiae bacterium]